MSFHDELARTRVVLRQPVNIVTPGTLPVPSIADIATYAESASYAHTASYIASVSGSGVTIGGNLTVLGILSASVVNVANTGQLETVFFVTQEGSDTNDGKKIETAFRTVKKAMIAASASIAATNGNNPRPQKISVRVKTGYYVEEAPIWVPPNTSILGDDLRTVVISPTSASRKENLFLMNNGTYAFGLRLEGCEIDSLQDPRKGFFFAFAPGAYIVTSPYVQNCTAAHTPADKFYVPLDYTLGNPEVGNGPGGMIVDDSILDGYSPLKSMIVDSYTQVAFNGIGLVVRGGGYAQMVSFFTNFSYIGVWAVEGGHASLLNSNTTFGDYGLRATGKRILAVPDVTNISVATSSIAASIVQAEKSSILNYMISKLQVSGSYSASYLDTGSATYKSTIKDGGILVEAIVSDLKDQTPGRTVQFTQGLFDGQDVSSGSIYTLPTASGFDEGAILAAFPVNNIFRYNETKCRRDVGYIVDAIATDLIYGGNERSIKSGVYYYKYPSVATTTQLQKTLQGLNYAGNVTQQLLVGTSGSAQIPSVQSSSNLIVDIVENGTGSLPATVYNTQFAIKTTNASQYIGSASATISEVNYISSSISIVTNIVENGTGSLPIVIPYTTASVNTNVLAAYTILKNNITFIQEETIAYLSSSWSDFDYDSTKCKRDVGYIISGAAEDLLYGSNSASVASGYYYYLYPSQATTVQLDPTLDGINYASGLAQKLITNTVFTAPSATALSAYNIIRSNRDYIQNRTIDNVNDNLVYDFIRAWKYIKEYILIDPDGKFGTFSLSIKEKVGQLIDIPINTIVSTVLNLEPTLLQVFGSLITSTSHVFEFGGAGANFLALPSSQGGIGRSDADIRIFQETGGRVYSTFGDETGDFFAGKDFVIRQSTGTIEGRTFNKSIAARFTPLNLALEG